MIRTAGAAERVSMRAILRARSGCGCARSRPQPNARVWWRIMAAILTTPTPVACEAPAASSERTTALVGRLRRPSSYPHPVDSVEVLETHISVVLLAGEFAYKIKK